MTPKRKQPVAVEAWAAIYVNGDGVIEIYDDREMAEHKVGFFGGTVVKLTSAPPVEGKVRKLERAIRWALGEIGEFPPREEGRGAYWWRTELRRRAGMDKPRRTTSQKTKGTR